MPRDGRLTCDEALRRLDDYVDRALTDAELRRVEAHLRDCFACADAARFESGLIAEIRARLRRVELPLGLAQAVHAGLTIEPE